MEDLFLVTEVQNCGIKQGGLGSCKTLGMNLDHLLKVSGHTSEVCGFI